MVKIEFKHNNFIIKIRVEGHDLGYSITRVGEEKSFCSGNYYYGDLDNLTRVEEHILKETGFKIILEHTYGTENRFSL